jgi:hypothetical protein
MRASHAASYVIQHAKASGGGKAALIPGISSAGLVICESRSQNEPTRMIRSQGWFVHSSVALREYHPQSPTQRRRVIHLLPCSPSRHYPQRLNRGLFSTLMCCLTHGRTRRLIYRRNQQVSCFSIVTEKGCIPVNTRLIEEPEQVSW